MTAADLSQRDRFASLAAIYACIFANGLGMGLSLPLLSLILEREGVSATMNGANAMFGAAAMMIVTPFIPALAARFGTLNFLAASYVTASLTLLLFPATTSLLLWFPLRFILNSALQCLFVVSEIWINSVAPDGMRGRLIAIYTSVFAIGFGLGPLMIQVLGTTGWAPFVCGAITMMSALLPLLMVQPRLIPNIEHADASAMFGFVLESPTAAAAAVCFGAIESCASAFIAVYAVRQGTSEASATLLLSAWAIGNIVLVPALGWLSDRQDRRIVLMGCALASTAAALSMPFFQGVGASTLSVVFLWGGFVSALYALGLTHLGERFTGHELASANSAFAILYAAGVMAGPALGGIAMDAWNPHGLIAILALIPAVFAALAGWRAATIPRRGNS
jgi:MFS family permease